MDNFEKSQRTTLYASIFLCAAYLTYLLAVYFFSDAYPSGHVSRMYQFGMILFSVMYFVHENRHRQYVYNPYELGFFMWIFWPIYLPYYLVKSRRLRGLGIFAVLFALISMENIVHWVWYALSNDAV